MGFKFFLIAVIAIFVIVSFHHFTPENLTDVSPFIQWLYQAVRFLSAFCLAAIVLGPFFFICYVISQR